MWTRKYLKKLDNIFEHEPLANLCLHYSCSIFYQFILRDKYFRFLYIFTLQYYMVKTTLNTYIIMDILNYMSV